MVFREFLIYLCSITKQKTKNKMENLHALEIKFYAPTNNSSARVGIISKRFKQRIIINYLTKNGFNIVGKFEFGESDIILSDTFKPLK